METSLNGMIDSGFLFGSFFYGWNGMNNSIHLTCLVIQRNGMVIKFFF